MELRNAAVCCGSRFDSVNPTHTIIEPPPCFTIGEILVVIALSPTFRHTLTPLFNQKISNFDSSIQRSLFHCSLVQSLCALAHWSLLTKFCFLNSGILPPILPYKPASLCLFPIVDVDTFFATLVQLCCDVWSSQPSVTQVAEEDWYLVL